MLPELLAERAKVLARRCGWSIPPALLVGIAIIWDILEITHTIDWLIEKLRRFPTIRWFAVVAMNHSALTPLAMVFTGLVWLGMAFWPAKNKSSNPMTTHPATGDVVHAEPMTVSGAHNNEPGNYWLVTNCAHQRA